MLVKGVQNQTSKGFTFGTDTSKAGVESETVVTAVSTLAVEN